MGGGIRKKAGPKSLEHLTKSTNQDPGLFMDYFDVVVFLHLGMESFVSCHMENTIGPKSPKEVFYPQERPEKSLTRGDGMFMASDR